MSEQPDLIPPPAPAGPEKQKLLFDFFVDGTPAPGGSKKVIPIWKRDGTLVWTWKNGKQWPSMRVIDDAGQANTVWKQVVAWQAKAARPRDFQLLDGPLEVRLNFWVHRPANQTTSKGAPTSHWRDYPTTRPDALKFARSTEDALTGILWVDDAANITLVITKQYCGPGERTGCRIRITPL